MAIEGNIEDISIVDVVQLLHLTQKTGTLSIQASGGKALLTFKDGAINSATFPKSGHNLGKALLDLGAVTEAELSRAITAQKKPGSPARPLGQLLVESGAVEPAVLTQAMERLIELILLDVVSLRKGSFSFTADAPVLCDDFQHVSSSVMRGISVNTQMVLLDVLRIYDEKNKGQPGGDASSSGQPTARDQDEFAEGFRAPKATLDTITESMQRGGGAEPEPAPEQARLPAQDPAEQGDEDDEVLSSLEELAPAGAEASGLGKPVVLLCSQDGLFKSKIREHFKRAGVRVVQTSVEHDALKEIESYAAENMKVIAVLDLPGGEASAGACHRMERLCEVLRSNYPEVPVIIVLDEREPQLFRQAFKRGCRSALLRPHDKSDMGHYVNGIHDTTEILMECVQSILTQPAYFLEKQQSIQSQIMVLRNKIQEFQKRRVLHEISMTLLGYMAEQLRRSIMFLVRPDDLLGLGSFGFEGIDKADPTDIMKLKIPLDGTSLLVKVIKEGLTFHGETDDAFIERHIFQKFGRPTCDNILLLPLRAENRTILLCYGDFGNQRATIFQIEALEIISCLAGMAFENALLRKKLQQFEREIH